MPRNTICILIRFLLSVEDLACFPLCSQDLIDLDQGKMIIPAENMFESEPVEGAEDNEGDEFKALVTGDIKTETESTYYNKGLEARIEAFKRFKGDANLKSFLPVRVIHCPQSHGIVITSNFGRFGVKRVESELQWRLQAERRADS